MNRSRQDYLAIISAYDRETHKWDTRAKRIVKRYRDERLDSETTGRRYNVLWSNVETLKPFLYSATPKPVVSNRGDMKDHIAREAAQVLEKALTYTIAEDHFGTTLRNARDDYLLAGRGTAWVRYVPEMQKAQPEAQVSENNTDDKPGSAPDSGIGDAEEIVTFETVVADYVHWRDFGHDLARTWEEVDCVWRKVAMTRQALIKRFPECGHEVPLDVKTGDREDRRDRDESSDKAMIYELWSKSEKRAVWLSKSYPKVLDELEDPLQLDHFFPCPRPIYATLTTDSLIPVPDYAEYQDQADELDELTRRIAAMTKAIKAVGVYDASVPALERILNDGHDNTLIPVENWAGLSEKGGLAGAMEMLPVKEVAETLLSLYEARKEVKADLYEITGMSDIIRGSTAPEETATAQRIKSNFASKRLDERQRQVERFARNLIDLIGNIIAVHFDPATLQAMTGCKLMSDQMKQIAQQVEQMKQQLAPGSDPSQPPPPPSPQMMQQMKAVSDQAQAMLTQAKMTMEDIPEAMKKPSWDDIIKLLRDHPRRRFSIDIETDSIVAPDDAEMQQERGQFLQSVTQFMQEAGQMIAAQPSVAPLMGQLLMFGVQGFRIGRDLQDAFEEYIDQATKEAAQPKQPPPDPKMAAVQAKAQADQAKQQSSDQLAHAKLITDQQHALAQSHADAEMAQRQQEADAQKHAADLQQAGQIEALKAHFADQSAQHAAALNAHSQQQQAMMDAMLTKFKAELDAQTKIEVAEITAGAALDAAQITAAKQGAAE